MLNARECSPNPISASKGKKEPWCPGFRSQKRGLSFKGEWDRRSDVWAKPCVCGDYDLVLLLHVCALPVFREQWQYSVKLPFLIRLKVCISFLSFEFFSRKKERARFTLCCTNIKIALRGMKRKNTSFRILPS